MQLLSTLPGLALMFSLSLNASAAPTDQGYPETAGHYDARVKWLKEARFGMFIHWGVYAVASGEWKGKYYGSGGEWIERIAAIPIAQYKALGKDFSAPQYDPKAWADLAQDAGMKYVVITAKHHDGFAMYDSKVNDWNAIKSSAAGRDLIEPLAKAVRADGLKFGLYYSQSQDWTNPGGGNYGNAPRWDPAQNGDYDAYLQTTALPQVREILTKFHPSVIWWDTPVNMTPERAKPFAELLHELAPGIISNSRLGGGYGGDTDNAEQHIPARANNGGKVLEVCMTMNDTWSFKRKDQNWKSVAQLLRVLSDCASKGGNLLLNVGPTADGEIPKECVASLQAIGRWLKANGEAIYATDGGPFPRPLPWGRVTRKADPAGATTLYLHVWDWPADGKLLLPTLQETPVSGQVLKTGAPVMSESTPQGVVVTLPGTATDPDISVVTLHFAGPVTVTQESMNTPGADGRIDIGAMEAYPDGDYSGCLKLINPGNDAYLTDWTNPDWKLEYLVKTPAAGKWLVSAEFAAEVPAKLTMTVRNTTQPVAAASAGGKLAWQTVDLGTVELPAGASTLQFKAVKADWKGGPSIRRLWLTPVKK